MAKFTPHRDRWYVFDDMKRAVASQHYQPEVAIKAAGRYWKKNQAHNVLVVPDLRNHNAWGGIRICAVSGSVIMREDKAA